MHRVLIKDQDQDLLYRVKNLLEEHGEKPFNFNQVIFNSLVIAKEYLIASKKYGFEPFKGLSELES